MTLAEDLARTIEEPRYMSDDEIERRAWELMAEHPPDQDNTLDLETRMLLEKCRTIARRRDSEPTLIRSLK